MNTNLLAIVKQIVETQGEEILSEPQRMKAFFSDLAKDEPKPDRIAFGRCLEHGFAQILKNADVTERDRCKQGLAKRLRDEEGLDLTLCENSLELLSAVLFGERQQQKKDYCKNCGKELQAEWKACPYCATVVENTGHVVSSVQTSETKRGGYDNKQIKPENPIVSKKTVAVIDKCVGCIYVNFFTGICNNHGLSIYEATKKYPKCNSQNISLSSTAPISTAPTSTAKKTEVENFVYNPHRLNAIFSDISEQNHEH